MTLVRYEEFLPEVLPYLPDCPQNVAVNALRNASIEFCDRSGWWLYEHPDVPTTGDEGRYPLDLPDYTQACRVHQAWHDEQPLTPYSEDAIRRLFHYDWRSARGNPGYILSLTSQEVAIVPAPTPTMAGTLKMIVALRPTRDSFDIDETVYQRWVETIATGARARLLNIPNQTFHDPVASMQARTVFNAGVSEAYRERLRGMQRSIARVKPVRWV